jgi:transcriptional regulator with XRE-family HTH domain
MALSQGPFYRELGERLRRARQSARLSQGRLADSVGMSRSSIANIERGRQPVYIHALVGIAKELQTPVLNLIPSPNKDLDTRTREAVKRLPGDQRRFVNLILQKSTPSEKETDGPEIFPSKKAGRRATKTSTHQKGADTR